MNGIIGVWYESPNNINSIVEPMLRSLAHRGSMNRVETIRLKNHNVAVCCLSHPATVQQIFRSPKRVAALNGTFYDQTREIAAKYLHDQMSKRNPHGRIRGIINGHEGFSGLFTDGELLCAFRDASGLRPLYYGHTRHITAFASERKALWAIGIPQPQPIPSGSAIFVSSRGIVESQFSWYRRPREKRVSFARAANILKRLLEGAAKKSVAYTGSVCVAFSGGLDSAITAVLARRAGVEVRLVSVGLRDSVELATVERFAEELKMPIHIQEFDASSLEEYVPRVLWLIEEPSLMKVSVAIPLHWAAMLTARCRCNIMLCGQGSDELYGGYSKYARTLASKGRKALRTQLYSSAIESTKVNYDRDDQATSTFPVELRMPFTDPEVIRFSLTIPSEYKVKSGDDEMRKWILREVAERLGVPEDIVWRRKKAIQHGTGVEKAIVRIARHRGLEPQQYLADTFEKVRGMQGMP